MTVRRADRYTPWREEADDRPRRRPPTGRVALVLGLGSPFRVSAAAGASGGIASVSSFLVGMYDEPAWTEHVGEASGVQIDLSPALAYALAGVPMHELANRVVPLDDLDTVDVDRLLNRVLELPTWAARSDMLDDELAATAAAGPPISPQVEWAHHVLQRAPNTRIAALADRLGWSRPTLVERFRREVGLTPKAAARVWRFRGALDRMRSSRRGRWPRSRPTAGTPISPTSTATCGR
jgi:hypothetical protein